MSANVGRYAKLPSYTTLGYRNAEGQLANRDALKYIMANHLVVGVSHRPMEGVSLAAEAFYKTYEHYPISLAEGVSLASKGAEYAAVGDEAVAASGLGRAYGAEVVARVQLPQGAMLSATYTLFRSEFTNRAGQFAKGCLGHPQYGVYGLFAIQLSPFVIGSPTGCAHRPRVLFPEMGAQSLF